MEVKKEVLNKKNQPSFYTLLGHLGTKVIADLLMNLMSQVTP